MKSIIEEFYLGKIAPGEVSLENLPRQKEAVKDVAEAEKILLDRLDEECRTVLEKLINAQTDIDSFSTLDSYVRGFRHGARFMLDILQEDEEEMSDGI